MRSARRRWRHRRSARRSRFTGAIREIGVYGVELHASDGFAHERPNIEFLLGFARGVGLTVEVSPTSAIFDRQTWQKLGKYDIRYPARYGYVP